MVSKRRRQDLGTKGLSDRALARLTGRIAAMHAKRRQLTDRIRAADHAILAAEREAEEIREAVASARAERRAVAGIDWPWRSTRRDADDLDETEEDAIVRRIDENLLRLHQRQWRTDDERMRARRDAEMARLLLIGLDEASAPVLVYLNAKREAVVGRRDRERARAVLTMEAVDTSGQPARRKRPRTSSAFARAKRSAIRRAIVEETWLDLPEFHGGGAVRRSECEHCGDPLPPDRHRFCSRQCHERHAEAFGLLMPWQSGERIARRFHPVT